MSLPLSLPSVSLAFLTFNSDLIIQHLYQSTSPEEPSNDCCTLLYDVTAFIVLCMAADNCAHNIYEAYFSAFFHSKTSE